MVTGIYKGKAPLQHPSGTHVDVIHDREGDEHAHRTNICAGDSALYNSYIAWELSKIMLLPWDIIEEQRDRSMDGIIAGLFPTLVRVSSSYLFLFLPSIDRCVPD